MLVSLARLKAAGSYGVSYINNHRRLLLLIFLVLPWSAYFVAWTLSTTETFFPRPLRQAKEVLIVVAHPDDECTLLNFMEIDFQRSSSHLVFCGRYGVVRERAICSFYQ